MWEEALRQAAANGLWALLFVALLVFILKDGKRREEKYQETVRRLSQSLNVVLDIRDDVKEVCQSLQGLRCVMESKRVRKSATVKFKEVNENELENET
ncbi:MAG: BhlA/UviB family holin-like peptide [Clostridia bacterium]|nr:BhlA/UviB family holin-like peptide [Clostridia bacterium]